MATEELAALYKLAYEQDDRKSFTQHRSPPPSLPRSPISARSPIDRKVDERDEEDEATEIDPDSPQSPKSPTGQSFHESLHRIHTQNRDVANRYDDRRFDDRHFDEKPAKKGRAKPAALNLDSPDKRKSRVPSIVSALLSPKRKMKGISISSPLMTPNTATFAPDTQEMHPMSPRYYQPPAVPPLPGAMPITPEQSPPNTARDPRNMSIAERLSISQEVPPTPRAIIPPVPQLPDFTVSIDDRIQTASSEHRQTDSRGRPSNIIIPKIQMPGEALSSNQSLRAPAHSRDVSEETGGVSPMSTDSQEPLVSTTPTSQRPSVVGLPMSPKPGLARMSSMSSLPVSPRPGSTFSGPVPPTPQAIAPSAAASSYAPSAAGLSAVRTGGALPFRAFESTMASPSATQTVFRQTTFERNMLSPTTPFTGTALPYSPYQPFSPCVPMTPSLVTKEDRKRMRRMMPKTPTMEMVKSSEEIW